MKIIARWVITIGLFMIVSGCVNNDSSVIKSKNASPENFSEIAHQPEGNYQQYLVMRAVDASTFQELVTFYNVDGDVSEPDFNEKGALFIATYESSCESFISKMKIVDRSIHVDIDSEMTSGGCADIAKPRSFIIELDKVDLQETNEVIFKEGHDQWSVPIVELEDLKEKG